MQAQSTGIAAKPAGNPISAAIALRYARSTRESTL